MSKTNDPKVQKTNVKNPIHKDFKQNLDNKSLQIKKHKESVKK